jgi:P-type Ca2+ transporter type 2C
MKSNEQIYNLSPNKVLRDFNSSEAGLSNSETLIRIKKFGRNEIKKKQNWKWLKLIFGQFNDAFVWILLAAAALAVIFGEARDVTIILVIVFINAIIGFFQEFKAERTLESIRKLTTDKAQVLRDGKKVEIDSRFIVPGDIVLIYAGDNVPADGYILESYELRISSFIFTGESRPEAKKSKIILEKNVPLADIDNMVFMGESVAAGEAKYVVTGTGMNTELGKIANLTNIVKDELTPMQKQMRHLGKNISILAASIGTLVMIAGRFFELSFYDNFLFALALAVSVVPEGLPAAISVALSLGMKKLLKHNVLTKKLNAVETLGSVSIICTDKTGTITKNELTVTKVIINNEMYDVSGEGYNPVGSFNLLGKIINPSAINNLELISKIGTLCNDASLTEDNGGFRIMGDPTEGAIIVAGKKYNHTDGFFERGEKKITEIPFSSERMRMSVVYKNKNVNSYVKGSPDVMLSLCKYQKINNKIVDLKNSDREKIKKMYDDLSSQALRVLSFAYRDLNNISQNKYAEEAEKNLIYVGMMAMIDPPRSDVRDAINNCRDLGIDVIMITGDYEITARAIAENIGLAKKDKNAVINGKLLDKLTDREIYKKIKNGTKVFARIAPEQKLRIANILKANKQVIAMTGDGVNDAPALKRADIGVAMGIMGTDVSKEASDMILMDDNFSSIVNGIREGRTVFQNLKKFVHYVLTSNASELFSVIFGVLIQVPYPIMAVQILCIDLATDIFPSFSLSVEPPEPGIDNKIINSRQSIMTWKGFRRIVYVGSLMAAGAVVTFIWSMWRGGWRFGDSIAHNPELYIRSTSATFAVLAMTQMANLLHSRSETLSPFKLGFFRNKFAIISIFISLGILLSFMYLPFFRYYLHMSPIFWQDWMMVVICTVAVFLFEEARKEGSK